MLKQFYATVQKYTRPFCLDTGVQKSGDDLLLVVKTRDAKGESVTALEIECISGDKNEIIVKIVPGNKVRTLILPRKKES